MIKPLSTYAAPNWYTNSSASSIRQLQSIQNAALRISSGAVLMTSQEHLHVEAELLTVDQELSMLSRQFLLGALRPGHPSNAVVSTDPGPRNLRSTLRSRFLPSIQSHLQDGATPEDSYRQSLAEIHRGAVADAIAASGPNRVLGQPPPASQRRGEKPPPPPPDHPRAAEVGLLLGLGGLSSPD